jgi:hypothetical protein
VTVLDDRFVTLGLLNGIVLAVVHTETDDTIRIISARKATRYEEESFFRQIAHGLEAFEEDE